MWETMQKKYFLKGKGN